ncbi:MAG: YrdB family protein [Chloroflexota bacterium]|nr:YrdB family protein [Chloroflexota bacterium]
MYIIKGANLALRFLLELCMLAALGYWGFTTGRGTLARWGLGIGAPLVAAVVWGLFLAPNSSMRLQGPPQILLEIVIFGVAIGALYVAGRPTLAGGFALVVVINRVLMMVWGQ